ncbi:hypothetical protein [Pararhizobium sp. A13]|uniref:hypothetical protein n=1 Tax=Pararhizobium sp. A13 TaxID=3133975 RepID=UPI00324AB1F7
MRARRCTGCGDRFYVNPDAPSDTCQDCSGDFDPSAQAKQDAENIARVNDARVLGRRKQTVDLNTLRQAQAEATADAQAEAGKATRGKKVNDQ